MVAAAYVRQRFELFLLLEKLKPPGLWAAATLFGGHGQGAATGQRSLGR